MNVEDLYVPCSDGSEDLLCWIQVGIASPAGPVLPNVFGCRFKVRLHLFASVDVTFCWTNPGVIFFIRLLLLAATSGTSPDLVRSSELDFPDLISLRVIDDTV